MLKTKVITETSLNGQIDHRHEQVSRSFLFNYILLLEQYATDTNKSYTDIDGLSSTSTAVPAQGLINVGGGNSLLTSSASTSWADSLFNGIVVGTGTTAVTPTDTKLAALITHGNATGQLQYHGNAYEGVTIVAANATSNFLRYFKNDSGATITVTEIGIYATHHSNWSPRIRSICIARDVLTTAINVLAGQTLKVTYQTTITL